MFVYLQMVSLVSSPNLLEKSDEDLSKLFSKTAIERARLYYRGLGESGAYTHSQGAMLFREKAGEFFERRDGFRASAESIFFTNGASDGLNTILTCLIEDNSSGVMLPLPQYPLYTATMTRLGGSPIFYDLDEQNGWSLNLSNVMHKYNEAKINGLDVKAIVIISPGNPAPTLLSYEEIKGILTFAQERKMLVIADEVYQDNIWHATKQFVPFRKVLLENKLSTQLASVHSASKGYYGECGFRAGVMQLENIASDALVRRVRYGVCARISARMYQMCVQAIVYKMRSVELCSNTMGQVIMTSILSPPVAGDDCYEQFETEKKTILAEMKEKAELTASVLNSVEGVSCQPIAGAMYAFPSLTFSEANLACAKKNGVSIETAYSMAMLEETGIVTTPGCGFGQQPGTHHIRMTILPQIADLKTAMQKWKIFHTNFVQTYV